MSNGSFPVPSLSVYWANTRQVTSSLVDTRSVDVFTVHFRQKPAGSLSLAAIQITYTVEQLRKIYLIFTDVNN